MRCPIQDESNPELLLEYCAHRLEPEARAAVDLHLADCADCRRFTAGQQALWTSLDQWEAPPVSREFDASLQARVASGWRWPRLFGWKPALPVAAACTAAVLALLLSAPPPMPQPAETPQVRGIDIEQVEQAIEDYDMLRQFSSEPAA